jgi:predicted nucleic acid-binding protein
MMFWDSSAIVSLCVTDGFTAGARRVLRRDARMVVWWGTSVECCSAFARLRREGSISSRDENDARRVLDRVSEAWTVIQPSPRIAEIAAGMLLKHPLSAADALQLAAAMVWTDGLPHGHTCVCFDRKLRDAARLEDFGLLPDELRG